MRITPEMTIAETIRRYPPTIRVFELHHVVACCTPARTVHAAATRFGADEEALLRMLNQAASG